LSGSPFPYLRPKCCLGIGLVTRDLGLITTSLGLGLTLMTSGLGLVC